MIFWLNRLSPPLADLAGSTDPFVAAAQREVRRWGYDLRVADLTTDLGIPVLLAIATREDLAAPALVVGAGAALDPRHAIRKALRELLGGIRGWKDVEWTVPELLELDDVRRLADHARAYYHPGWLSRADFLWSSPDRTRVPAGIGADRSATEQLASLVAHLKDAGLDLLAVELTTPDVARHGIHVLRAVVPGLQPIGFGPAGLRLGGRRLYEAPRTMGYTSSNTTEESLNPDPHCYP